MTRRIAPLIALAALALLPSAAYAARGFSYSVAAGEVTSKSAHLWARANSAGRGVVEVAKDKRITKGVKDASVVAEEDNDFTVQRVVKGLKPDTPYFYRFTIGR